MFLQILYPLKRSFSSIDAFHQRKQISRRFLWPVAKCSYKNREWSHQNYQTKGENDRHYLRIAGILVTNVDAIG